jgi:8-oxo-dGTP diphosphatase
MRAEAGGGKILPGNEIQVCCGIIMRGDRVLIARRKKGKARGGLWEFPGGKVEEGECPEACLERELFEELGVRTEILSLFGENSHSYEDLSLRLIAYNVRILAGEPRARDHEELRFVPLGDLFRFSFSDADLAFAAALAGNSGILA